MAILLILSCLGLFCMLAGLFKSNLTVILSVVGIGLVAAIASSFYYWNQNWAYFNDMVYFDNYAIAFSDALIIGTLLLIFLSQPFVENLKGFEAENFALILFALTGMVAMVSYDNLSMLFIGIEIMSVALYILAGSNKGELESNEASLKYFLLGAFATGFLLMGIALIYAETSSFYLDGIAAYLDEPSNTPSALLPLGIICLLVGLLFKVSAVPFHFWTPDVYEGSPTYITAFMSTVAKTAALAAFYRLFSHCFFSVPAIWGTSIAVIAALTITIGSLGATYQMNIKRLLAYSSVSNAGFMLLTLVTLPHSDSPANLLFYTVAYALAGIASMSVIAVVANKTGSLSVDAFDGLSKTNPLLGIALTVSMLSLAGIPVTAGFFGKFYVLYSSMESGYLWLVLVALANSMIGIYYYFKILIAVNFKSPSSELEGVSTGFAFTASLFVCIGGTVLLGIFPDLIYQLLP